MISKGLFVLHMLMLSNSKLLIKRKVFLEAVLAVAENSAHFNKWKTVVGKLSGVTLACRSCIVYFYWGQHLGALAILLAVYCCSICSCSEALPSLFHACIDCVGITSSWGKWWVGGGHLCQFVYWLHCCRWLCSQCCLSGYVYSIFVALADP